ncbi:MAG TPA: choice-of-anchor D domain-containing protein [Candidatus Kapabacteria bacterium]|nr:choice-of-anchor D domain-containing protein [Candidatus Kapabacteria bacterium]
MRRFATLFLILLTLAPALRSQPQVAYMIPDIGAAGMNSYVEIIGFWSAFQTFGNQDVAFEGPAPALTVEPANAADNARIVCGPAVVHWEGRMISTQIFVKRGAANGRCDVVVVLNGVRSTPIRFEIVTPQDLTLTNGAQLGTGTPGTANWRSPRGAMLVRNLTLSGTITAQKTIDLDGATPGLQQYLPLVLLAQGNVTMAGGTVIELSANNRDGGVGGGGGGGQVCDAHVFTGQGASGSGGGNGYTGGAWGGRNNRGSTVRNDIRASNGTGTGPGTFINSAGNASSSLNLAPGGIPIDVCYPESAGGGTGHPFGDGGTSSCGGTQTATAGHGGGGGSANGTPGAGANHFGTAGNGGGQAGLRIGNIMCVPLSGGSGGSSGNPQGSDVCAGEGGGGGGAIAVYSQQSMTSNGAVVVRGGPGGQGVQGGGGGSGGMAIVGAKDWRGTGGTLYSAGGVGGVSTVSPFQPGGVGAPGRLRFDGFTVTEPTLNETQSRFIGPTTDTLTYVDKPTFRLWGTYANTSHDIYVWIKGDNAIPNWTRIAGPGAATRVSAGPNRRWFLDITVPTGGNYYIAVGQEDPNTLPNTDRWERSARVVLSQAAANMIFVDLIPKTNADTTIRVGDLVCESMITGTFEIINTGFAELVVQRPTLVPTTDFQITQPTVWPQRIPGVVNDGDTNRITVTWVFAPLTPGTKTTTATFVNNDPRVDGAGQQANPRDPLVVTLIGRKLAFNAAVSTPTLNLGEICVGDDTTRSLDFLWTGDTTARILAIEPLGAGPFTILSPTTPTPTAPRILANARVPITVRFAPTAEGTFSRQYRIVVDPCDTVLFTVTGTAVRASIAVNPQPIDFGQVAVGTTASQAVTIANNGTARGTISNVYFVPPDPALTAPNVIGQALPPTVSIPGQVTYAPTAPGRIAPGTMMCVVFDGVCPDTVCIPISGTAITSLLRLSRTELELRAEPCADPAPEEVDTLTLVNAGLAPETINSIAPLGGEVTVTTSRASYPTVLAGGDTILITVRWMPGTSGTETIRVLTTSQDPDQAQMDITVRRIRERSAIEVLDSAGNAIVPPVDFGSLFGCDAGREIRFRVRSLGTMTEQVGVRLVDGSAFTVTPRPAFTINGGGEVTLTVRFETTGSGDFFDTLIVTNEICDVEYRIPVIGRRTGLSYTSAPIAFGQSNVGVGVAGTTFLRFDSTTTNDIRSVVRDVFIRQTGSSFAITRRSLPATLAPNELTTVEVTFTPAAQQTYSAELCWVIESPCLDTICVPLTGEGILANLVVTGSLDFGSHFVCQDSSLVLRIENTGTATVTISDITQPTSPAFIQVTPTTFPIVLAPRSTPVLVTYRFDPALAPADGLQTADVIVRSDDPNRRDITVRLVGERRRQAIQMPAALDFGQVDVGTTSAPQTLTLYNRTDAPLRGRLTISGPYRIVSPLGPITIPPSPGSIDVTVEFTPVDSNDAPGTLIAYYDEPCADSTVIPITGRGRIIAIGSAAVVIPDSLEGAPGDLVSIPIILERGTLLNEAEATTFRATLRFNRNLLYPRRVRSGNEALPKPVTGLSVAAGSIISQTIDGDDRVVTIEVSNDPMPAAPDTIAWLDATVMLGDRLTTPIAIDTLFFTDGQVLTVTDDGLFTLIGYCEVGINRLVRITGAAGIKAVSPNPFNPSTEVVFETSESGPTTLQVSDAGGRLVQRLIESERLPVGVHTRTWDAGDLPSGVYYLELLTPTQRSIQRAVLVK